MSPLVVTPEWVGGREATLYPPISAARVAAAAAWLARGGEESRDFVRLVWLFDWDGSGVFRGAGMRERKIGRL